MWFKTSNKETRNTKRFNKGRLTKSITNEIFNILFQFKLIHHRCYNYNLHMSKHIRTKKKTDHNQSSSSSFLFCKSRPLIDYPSQIKNLKLITIRNS
ncbi:hypothetical protein Hanom_Chr13g01211181 [Helianthus anomalus]